MHQVMFKAIVWVDLQVVRWGRLVGGWCEDAGPVLALVLASPLWLPILPWLLWRRWVIRRHRRHRATHAFMENGE